jgi:hypothetical protein
MVEEKERRREGDIPFPQTAFRLRATKHDEIREPSSLSSEEGVSNHGKIRKKRALYRRKTHEKSGRIGFPKGKKTGDQNVVSPFNSHSGYGGIDHCRP